MKYLNIAFLVSIFVFSLSCKKIGEAETQSLDNFAGMVQEDGTTFKVNKCWATMSDSYKTDFDNYVSKGYISAPSNLMEPLRNALAAVPAELRILFFDRGEELVNTQGSILVNSTEAKKACEKFNVNGFENTSNYKDGNSLYNICWDIGSKMAPVIYVQESEEAIYHGLVRTFAYFYTQYVLGSYEKSSSAKLNDIPRRINPQIQNIASTFINEIAQNKSKFTAYDELKKLYDSNKKLFTSYVFAEAMDSFFCSEESLQSFEKNFPSTYAAATQKTITVPNSNEKASVFDLGDVNKI